MDLQTFWLDPAVMIGQVLPEESENKIKFQNNIKFRKGYYSLFYPKETNVCNFNILSHDFFDIQPDLSRVFASTQMMVSAILAEFWLESRNNFLKIMNYVRGNHITENHISGNYSVLSIKRTGSLNYFEVFLPPWTH